MNATHDFMIRISPESGRVTVSCITLKIPCPMSVLFASGNLHAKTLSSPAQTLYAAGNARIAAPPERRSTMPGFRCIAISKSGMARRFILGS